MAPDSGLVPRAVLSSPERARKQVALIVALATGAAGLAGLWFRIEDGFGYRVILGLTSALFGWLTINGALSAKDAGSAGFRALGISMTLGALSIVIPGFVLAANENAGGVLLAIPFGAVIGAVIGFFYGIVLFVVASATWRHVASESHDGADRAVRIAAVWTVVPLAAITFVVIGFDFQELPEWASEKRRAAHEAGMWLGLVALGVLSSVAVGSFWKATCRIARREHWLRRIASGADPRWAIRSIGPNDDLDMLPRLRPGLDVLERRNEHAVYRASAVGEPVAII